MIDWYKKVVFENYANFRGRARREEFWCYIFVGFLISIVLGILDYVLGLTFDKYEFNYLRLLYSLLVYIPGFAVTVRRLHDVGKSGWFLFIVFIPIVGIVWLLVLFCKEGDSMTNKYGRDPKDIFDEMDQIGIE